MFSASHIVDLSHPLEHHMPMQPDPSFPHFTTFAPLTRDGYHGPLTLSAHTGTHADIPPHWLGDGKNLDSLGPDPFLGPGFRLDVRMLGIIGPDDLRPYEEELAKTDFLLLHTGWDALWGSTDYLKGYPTLSFEAAEYLCAFNLKGIGVDAISIDKPHAQDRCHHILFRENCLLIENLKNLHLLDGLPFMFSCLPLTVGGGDGAPVRAIAVFEHPLNDL